MKRKVVLHGPSTLIVSLPANWVKRYNIARGDELDVLEEGHILKITADKAIVHEPLVIDLKEAGPLVARQVLSVYHQGYDETTFLINEARQSHEIERCLKEMIGFEIVRKGEKECVVKDISGSKGSEFDTVLRRLFLLVKSLLEEAPRTLMQAKAGFAEEIVKKDFEINKLSNFCIRLLKKHMAGHPEQPTLFFLIMQLEMIGDEYKELALHMSKEDLVLGAAERDCFSLLSKLFTVCYKFHYSKKLETAKECAHLYTEVKSAYQRLSESPTAKRIPACIRSLLNMIIPIQGLQLSEIRG